MQISWYHCCGNNSFPYLFPSFKVVSVQPYVCDVVGSVQKRRPGLLLTVLLLLFCWKCCSILGHDGATMLKSWILKCKLCMCYVLTREPRGGWSKVVTDIDSWKHLVAFGNVGGPEQPLHVLGETDTLWRIFFFFPQISLPPLSNKDSVLATPKTLWQILSPLNVWTILKTSGQHLLKRDSWTSLLTCAAQTPQVERGLLCFYMKMISSCHSSSFAGWLNLLYNLYLIIALWSFEELWFWHWKTLLCNTWFSTGRGRLEWKKFSMQHGCRWGLFSPSWCWALWQQFWTAFSTGGKATTVSAVHAYISTDPVLLR